jgi:hypothetical protein
MFRRFPEGADERLPCLAETKTHLSVHIVWMELNLNGLTNEAIHILDLSGEDGGTVKYDASFSGYRPTHDILRCSGPY